MLVLSSQVGMFEGGHSIYKVDKFYFSSYKDGSRPLLNRVDFRTIHDSKCVSYFVLTVVLTIFGSSLNNFS